LRGLRLAFLLSAAALALPLTACAATLPDGGPSAKVGIFYYPWFGTPQRDGGYSHWQQGGTAPPSNLASSFYPARGAYSSADAVVVAAQMREIAAAGVDQVIVSWWGRGSREDRRLGLTLAAARAAGLSAAAHLEPYAGRSALTVEQDIGYLRRLGIADVYVYRADDLPAGALKALVELGRSGGTAPVPIGELARRRDIPVQFLEQLFAVLRRAGVLRSQRGVKGGYSFARDPSEVTVLEVVELLDGRLGAGAESIFSEAAEAARAVLGAATVADIVERENRDAGATMYYI
jgi:DNA-binding IscR family transcriptional regulator